MFPNQQPMAQMPQQNFQQQPMQQQQQAPAPAPVNWVDGSGQVLGVELGKNGINKKNEPWQMYKVMIADAMGQKKYTIFNEAPQMGQQITFTCKEEPYTSNQPPYRQGTSRTITKWQPMDGMAPVQQAPQQSMAPLQAPMTAPVQPMQQANTQAANMMNIDPAIVAFKQQYMQTATNPSVYEFIGVYMVKQNGTDVLVQQLQTVFNGQ